MVQMADGEGPSRRSLREFAEQFALSEVENYFNTPARLENLASVREDYERRLVAVETQLEAGVQAQLDEMQNAVMLLNMAREEMAAVRAKFDKINRRSQACTKAVHDFDQILKIRNARTNVREILQQLEIYDAVPRRVDELRSRLEKDARSLKGVFLEWLQLNAWRERILTDISDKVTEASRKEQDISSRVANWEELDSSIAHNTYGQSSQAHGQILQVLGDHFRRVEDLGKRIWDLVAARLSDFFYLAQFDEAPALIAAVEIVERIDLYNDRERARRAALGEAPEKLEMLIPPGQKRKDALAALEKAIESRLDQSFPRRLLPERKAPSRKSTAGARPESASDTDGDEEEDNDDDDDDDDDDEEDDDDEDDDDENDDDDEEEEEEEEDDDETKGPLPTKIPDFLRAGQDLIMDLNIVSEEIAKCFPDTYGIIGLYRWVAERRMITLLQPVWGSPRVTPGEKLQLVGFLDHYLSVVDTLDRAGADGDLGLASGLEGSSGAARTGYSSFASGTSGGGAGIGSGKLGIHHHQSMRSLNSDGLGPAHSGAGAGVGGGADLAAAMRDEHRSAAALRSREIRREAEGMMSTYIADALPRLERMMHAILDQNNEPVIGRGGALQTAIPEDLFNILAQELSVLRAHGVTGPHLASFVQRAILETLRTYQGVQTNRLAAGKTPEVGIEACCAMMNDFERMYDLCDKVLILEVRQGMDLSDRGADSLLSEIQLELDRVAGGFLRAIETATERTIELVFTELRNSGSVESLFSPVWESGEARTMDRFTATFLDYLEDPQEGFRVWLASELLFGRVVATALSRTVQTYILRLMGLRTAFTNKQLAVGRLRADAQSLQNFFSGYLDVLRFGKIRTQEALEAKIDVIWHCAKVIETEEVDFPPKHFADVATHFGPFSKQAIARLLFLRGDLSDEVRATFISEVADHDVERAAKFDLSSLPPTPELLLDRQPAATKLGANETAANKKTKTKKAKKSLSKTAKSLVKGRSKRKKKKTKTKKKAAAAGATSSTAAIEMSLDSFTSS
ncbi:Exocyst complex component SEC6 [Hondaea fermentalgiana]|uniref:Exocyst complex component SEC6 n=1 Tax=Hondaea fermentalgiana TaxID=2315210 RepID=A0A2R5G8M5_9STRA|nr:Exocyst complex component SEC6 [Hondaea fermentalgiana]|eukprot:GBG24833.1 Exocyst complex component SEC6 [Hondaea fermentalgiana]